MCVKDLKSFANLRIVKPIVQLIFSFISDIDSVTYLYCITTVYGAKLIYTTNTCDFTVEKYFTVKKDHRLIYNVAPSGDNQLK